MTKQLDDAIISFLLALVLPRVARCVSSPSEPLQVCLRAALRKAPLFMLMLPLSIGNMAPVLVSQWQPPPVTPHPSPVPGARAAAATQLHVMYDWFHASYFSLRSSSHHCWRSLQPTCSMTAVTAILMAAEAPVKDLLLEEEFVAQDACVTLTAAASRSR